MLFFEEYLWYVIGRHASSRYIIATFADTAISYACVRACMRACRSLLCARLNWLLRSCTRAALLKQHETTSDSAATVLDRCARFSRVRDARYSIMRFSARTRANSTLVCSIHSFPTFVMSSGNFAVVPFYF